MSTDGTQPRPASTPGAAPGRTSVRTPEKPAQPDTQTTAERPAVPRENGDAGPSVSERLKAAGAAVAGAVNRDPRPTSERTGPAAGRA